MGKGSVKSAKQKNKADKEYDVEKILHSRKNGAEYLVKWKNYGHANNSWVKKSWLNCPLKLKEFEKGEEKKKRVERKRKADSSLQHNTLQEEETADNDEQLEWEVEKITATTMNKAFLFVKWKGYGPAHCSWIKKSDLPYPKKLNKLRKQEIERNRISGNGSGGGGVRGVTAIH